MAILGVLAALIAAVGVALWRVNATAQAVRGLADAADDAHGLWRRWSWRRRLANDRIELVKKPEEAAAAMMAAVAQADGAITEREQRTLLAEFRKSFGSSEQDAIEMLAQARWTVAEVRELDRCLYKLGLLLTPEQKEDVVGLLERVAAAEGTAGPAVRASLDKFQRSLKP